MKKEKTQKPIKPGEPLKQSTVMVLSVTVGLFVVLLITGLSVPESGYFFIIAGAVIMLFGFLCTSPNLIGFLRGKKRERLIKQGKLVEEKQKDFKPQHRWGD